MAFKRSWVRIPYAPCFILSIQKYRDHTVLDGSGIFVMGNGTLWHKKRSAGIFMGRRETLPQKQPAADGEARLRASLLFRPYVQPHCCMPTSARPDIFRSPGPDRLPAFQAPRLSDPMPCPPAQYPRWGWWNRRSGSDPWPWRPMKRSYSLFP